VVAEQRHDSPTGPLRVSLEPAQQIDGFARVSTAIEDVARLDEHRTSTSPSVPVIDDLSGAENCSEAVERAMYVAHCDDALGRLNVAWGRGCLIRLRDDRAVIEVCQGRGGDRESEANAEPCSQPENPHSRIGALNPRQSQLLLGIALGWSNVGVGSGRWELGVGVDKRKILPVVPVRQVVPDAVAELVRKAPLSPEKVAFAWRSVVGPAIAQATSVEWNDGVLRVKAKDGAWQREVERSAAIIRSRLDRLLGNGVVRYIDVKSA
jgi:hypothetical protein